MHQTKIALVNGPNLNLLGEREPSQYGTFTLKELEEKLVKKANDSNVELQCFQSNIEGEIINFIHNTFKDRAGGLIINPGGYTHTSVAIRDAISATKLPTIEVHISNVYKREEFRHHSLIAPVCIGQIAGLGMHGYLLALEFLVEYQKTSSST
jgi:3-dehydroquinate dehydratase-2